MRNGRLQAEPARRETASKPCRLLLLFLLFPHGLQLRQRITRNRCAADNRGAAPDVECNVAGNSGILPKPGFQGATDFILPVCERMNTVLS